MWKNFSEDQLLSETDKKIIKLEQKVEIILNLLIILMTFPLFLLGIYLQIPILIYFGIQIILIISYQLFTLNLTNRQLLLLISCNQSCSFFGKQLIWLALLFLVYMSLAFGFINNQDNFKSEDAYCDFDILQIIQQITVGQLVAYAIFVVFPFPIILKYQT